MRVKPADTGPHGRQGARVLLAVAIGLAFSLACLAAAIGRAGGDFRCPATPDAFGRPARL